MDSRQHEPVTSGALIAVPLFAGDPPADSEARRLTTAVARGNEEAFRKLYDLYQARIFRLAAVLARGDLLLAQDTVQAVMLTAARKLKPLESDAHLWNWLALVTRQHIAKAFRRSHREETVLSLASVPDHPCPPEPDPLLAECLDAAVQALEGESRMVVEWFYYEGLSCEQIADRLETTAKAVSSRLERARAAIRDTIKRRLAHEA